MNVTIALATGAMAASLPLAGANYIGIPGFVAGSAAALALVEALKQSKAFVLVKNSLTKNLDQLSEFELRDLVKKFVRHHEFMLRIELPLRRLAAQDRPFEFINNVLDWLRGDTK